MNTKLHARLRSQVEERAQRSLERVVRVHLPEAFRLNLADNDYLGLSTHAEVIEAGERALRKYGASSSASPLITGFGQAHESLLDALKRAYALPHGMLWNTGYSANQAVLSHLPQKGDVVLADRLIHNSMVRGILSSGARLVRYAHLDMDALERLLEKEQMREGCVFVVSESVFSMDGDYPDLRAMAALRERYDFVWILDEAHAVGWYGERGLGLAELAGVLDKVDVLVGTLGKGLGAMGAFTLFQSEWAERYLTNEAGEFVYSTYLAPACAATAEKALELVMTLGAVRKAAQQASKKFREALSGAGLDVPVGDSPIVPVIVGEESRALEIAQKVEQAGIRVSAIRPPTVPQGQSRLRLSLRAGLSEEDYRWIVEVLRGATS